MARDLLRLADGGLPARRALRANQDAESRRDLARGRNPDALTSRRSRSGMALWAVAQQPALAAVAARTVTQRQRVRAGGAVQRQVGGPSEPAAQDSGGSVGRSAPAAQDSGGSAGPSAKSAQDSSGSATRARLRRKTAAGQRGRASPLPPGVGSAREGHGVRPSRLTAPRAKSRRRRRGRRGGRERVRSDQTRPGPRIYILNTHTVRSMASYCHWHFPARFRLRLPGYQVLLDSSYCTVLLEL